METKPLFKPNPKLKLMDQVREVLRYYHYAYRTEETYCKWILRFIRFFDGKVLHIPFEKNISTTHSKRWPKLPTELT